MYWVITFNTLKLGLTNAATNGESGTHINTGSVSTQIGGSINKQDQNVAANTAEGSSGGYSITHDESHGSGSLILNNNNNNNKHAGTSGKLLL